MANPHESLDAALAEVKSLRRLLKRSGSVQVRSQDELSVMKATGMAWFNNHRPAVSNGIDPSVLSDVDEAFQDLVQASDRNPSRAKMDASLKALSRSLGDVRSYLLTEQVKPVATVDEVPDFSALVSDKAMAAILQNRWRECHICVEADAPLSATVMMGGLLETLLLAKVLRQTDKSRVFGATSAPRDRSGKTLPLQEWTLRHYIDVAHELGWISQSAKDVGVVLRDYRNYVHPHKEHSHGVSLKSEDARLFWEVTKSITRQLL